MKKAIGILISMVLTAGMIGCTVNTNSNKAYSNLGENNPTAEKVNEEQDDDLDKEPNDLDLGNIIAKYEVKDSKIVYKEDRGSEGLSQEEVKKHNIIWERVEKLWPKSYIGRVVNFMINTDGKDGTMAEVMAVNDQNKKFILLMDIKDCFDESGKLVGDELNHTVVHEFAHLLTLNDTQIMQERNENSETYTTDEGTMKEKSYLNEFYQKYWANIYDEWNEIDEKANEDEENAEDIRYEFYEKYQDKFISDYAATNPGEDIAESFANFVLKDKQEGNSIKDKKILFFYDFDEAVKLREEIRNNLK